MRAGMLLMVGALLLGSVFAPPAVPVAVPGRQGAAPAIFDGPFHLVLNVAVGGNWGGQKDVEESTLPYVMEVEHVRVRQQTSTAGAR